MELTENKQMNNMNIVVASDENYAIHLLTLIVSILENRNEDYPICFYILDGGISESTNKLINDTICKYNNVYIRFIPMTEDIVLEKIGDKNIWRSRSLSTLSRLFIPDILSDENRALYLDVDGIVERDLLDFYNIDIDKYCIAGVQDMCSPKGHKAIELDDNDLYICAGVILWNLEMARSINFTDKVLDFVRKYNGKVPSMDQGIINGIFGKMGLTKRIHPKYNVMTPFFFEKSNQLSKIYDLTDYYSDDELKEACDNPVFIHFVSGGTTRPWEKHCKHPLKTEYWKYRNMLKLENNQLLRDKRTVKLRFTDWLYRHMPRLFIIITHIG